MRTYRDRIRHYGPDGKTALALWVKKRMGWGRGFLRYRGEQKVSLPIWGVITFGEGWISF
ncbi:MAG: hypothetical protein R2818_00800 [Flavobacteriales bacterium]